MLQPRTKHVRAEVVERQRRHRAVEFVRQYGVVVGVDEICPQGARRPSPPGRPRYYLEGAL
jgi:hypothetical protein